MLSRRSFIQALAAVPLAFALPPATARQAVALSTVHIDAILTKISVDYLNAMDVNWADRIFPIIPAGVYQVITNQPSCQPFSRQPFDTVTLSCVK